MKLVALLAAAAVLAPAQIPVRAANGQVISGQPIQPVQPVSFDCAADGSVINSATGEPIPRAHVGVLLPPSATSQSITDSSGRWSLSNVACGRVQVVATRPGFLLRPSAPVTLASGSPVHDVKIELIPQSVFYGKVVDDQGDPLTGVRIQVLASRVVNGRAILQASGGGNTNDLGEFRVAGLQKGKYVLCAQANQQIDVAGMVTGMSCYPGAPSEGAAGAMDVPAGREIKVDFTLNQVPALHVRGTVSGLPEGRNFGLNLAPRGATAGIGNTASTSVRDGKFDLKITAGSYMLTADYFEGGKRLLARVPIDVGGADIDTVVVSLDGGFTLTGNVRVESQSGQKALRSQPGIELHPLEAANATAQIKWDPGRTSFTFSDMVPGTYRLDVSSPGPFYVKSATLGGQDVLAADFSVAQAAGPMEIVLRDDGGSIEGDIVDANGQPTSGSVMALRNGRPVTIPSNGHFKLQNLAPGDYQVYAWDEPTQVEYADAEWMRRYGGSAVAVTVAAGQSSPVKLTIQTVPQ